MPTGTALFLRRRALEGEAAPGFTSTLDMALDPSGRVVPSQLEDNALMGIGQEQKGASQILASWES